MSKPSTRDYAALLAADSPDRVVHFTEYLAKQSQRQQGTELKCGFPEFEAKLGGLHTGEVTVISGPTGEGKTLFAESWMYSIMTTTDAVRPCVFSWEVSPSALLEKYTDRPNLPIYLPLELEVMDASWLTAKIMQAREMHGCQLFILDHLHYLVDMSIKQNMSLNIGAFMRRLKQQIAIGLDVAVILIAHQDKVDTKGGAREPGVDTIRDSSFIGQEADNVITVWRRPNFKDQEILEIKKQNPLLGAAIEARCPDFFDLANPFSQQMEIVKIDKARRKGTFRWKKLFQKVGHYFEEV